MKIKIIIGLLLLVAFTISHSKVPYSIQPYFNLKGGFDSAIPIPDTQAIIQISSDSTDTFLTHHDTSSSTIMLLTGLNLIIQPITKLLLKLSYDFNKNIPLDYDDGVWNTNDVSFSSRIIASKNVLFKLNGFYTRGNSDNIFAFLPKVF